MVVTRMELELEIEQGITSQLNNLMDLIGTVDQFRLSRTVADFRAALGDTIARAIIKAIQEGVAE